MADWIFFDNHTRTKPKAELAERVGRDVLHHWLIEPKENGEMKELLGGEHFAAASSIERARELIFRHHEKSFIRQTGRTHILCIEGAFDSTDVVVKELPLNPYGQVTEAALREVVRARSSLLSLPWADRLTGVVQPIHDLARVCKEHEIQLHLDLSAAISKLFCELSYLEADYLTFDAGLFHAPLPLAGILSKLEVEGDVLSYAALSGMKQALQGAVDQCDHFAMEIAPMRDQFEIELSKLGGLVLFQEVERLPNTVVVSFEGVHSEKLLSELRMQGVFATAGQGRLGTHLERCGFESKVAYSAISFALSAESTRAEVTRAIEILRELLPKLQLPAKPFSEKDAKAKGMRLCTGAAVQTGTELSFSLLVDEEDGVIADARCSSFAPPPVEAAVEASCDLLLRKNYMQARRLSADLIEKKMGAPLAGSGLNLILEAIDDATEGCMDIPIEDVYVAPPNMENGERVVYPGWEELSDAQRKVVITEVMDRDVRPYVELDAGGVEVLKVEANRVTIAYSGNCTSCFSATGATLDAIGNILRHKIYPDLMVVPDMSLLNQG